MESRTESSAADGRLDLILTPGEDRLDVRYRLDPAALDAGDVLAQLRLTVAGITTVAVADDELAASDQLGDLPLSCVTDDEARRWVVDRATVGAVEVRYPAPYRQTTSGHPPNDLRREAGGVTGTGNIFLALPPATRRWRMTLEWPGASSIDTPVEGTTDVLADCHYLAGGTSESCGPVTTWWLTPPPFDVRVFTEQIAGLHQVYAETFAHGKAGRLRVFLRSNTSPGLSGAGFPMSFVVGFDATHPDTGPRMYHHLAHELVHSWVTLDGEHDFYSWYVEGLADYFSSVLPYRHGLIDRATFLAEINDAARNLCANPHRDLKLRDAEALRWTDLRADRIAYTRGMFYFADLAWRLDGDLADLVMTTPFADWVDAVSQVTGADESRRFAALVLEPGGWPRADLWGPDFEYFEDEAPVLEFGFDPVTFMTRRVVGLVPGGPADRAGLREGDPITGLPGYDDLLRTRRGQPILLNGVAIELDWQTVPAWR